MSWNPFAKKMRNIKTPMPIGNYYEDDEQEQLKNENAELRKQLDYLQDNHIEYHHMYMRDLHPEFTMGFWNEEQLVRKQLFRSYSNCPSCGAPLNPAKDECEYCKTYCRFDKVYSTEVPEIDRPASL